MFRGHGYNGLIASYDSNGNYTGVLVSNNIVRDIYSYDDEECSYIDDFAKNQLASFRIVLYLGCYTGVDVTYGDNCYNLVDSTYEKGAHFVLGTTAKIQTEDGNKWLQHFLEALRDGKSIGDSILYADDNIGEIGITYINENGVEVTERVEHLPRYVQGDIVQYLDIN